MRAHRLWFWRPIFILIILIVGNQCHIKIGEQGPDPHWSAEGSGRLWLVGADIMMVAGWGAQSNYSPNVGKIAKIQQDAAIWS